MSAGTLVILWCIGLLAGIMSSIIGIGGGNVIVPALMILLNMDQLRAQGTSLAMQLPPIGALGVWQYYKSGQADLKVTALLCIAFVIGSFMGGRLMMNLEQNTVRFFPAPGGRQNAFSG